MMEQAGSKQRGFSLVELMIVVVVIAILASIALPSYQDYVKKSRARAATADLVAFSVAVENYFQRHLKYPSDREQVMTTWKDADSDFFTYDICPDSCPDNTYILTAIGKGDMDECDLTLQHDNTRTVSSASYCGISSW